jgi:elongation factor G
LKKYATNQIRNIGMFAHQGAGKTTTGDAMLYATGSVDRQGSVDAGNSVLDFDPDEIKRKITIYTSLAPLEFKDHKINCLDAPGFLDFIGEVISSIRVVDGAVLVMGAVSGVEVGLEKVWSLADSQELPRLLFINKMDKENANFSKCIEDAKNLLSGRIVPLQLPIGSQETFKGIVDLVTMEAWTFDSKGTPQKTAIPADMSDSVADARDKLMEAVSEADDALIEKYLEGTPLTQEEVTTALRKAVKEKLVFPALCGSALKNIGVTSLMNAIIDYFPSPAMVPPVKGRDPKSGNEVERRPDPSDPVSALVFKTTTDPYVGKLSTMRLYSGTLRPDTVLLNVNKEKEEKLGALMILRGKQQENITEVAPGDFVTVAKLMETTTGDTLCDKDKPVQYPVISHPEPMMSMAMFPKSKGDEDKLSSGLSRLMEEDLTFKVRRDAETKETVASGMGDLHIEIMMDRLKRKFGVEVELKSPKVPYKETIRSKVQIEGKHKKQSGGRGQYGHVWLELEPMERGKNFEFVDRIVGGVVPRNYIPSVEKGVRKAMEEGVLTKCPVVDVRVTLYDGSYHTVDSSDIAFQIAGGMAFRSGMEKAHPVLLEPIMNVEVIVPDQFMGDVIGDLNSKRGRILGMEPVGKGKQLIKATVPLAEMIKYSIDLRSMTQGRGTFTMSFSHYEEVPAQITEAIVAAVAAQKE